MKRWVKVLCAVSALLAVLLAGLYWRQRENVKAVRDAVHYSAGELEEKITENRQAIRDAVDAAPEVEVREVTEEERQALRDGTMTREELEERLLDTGKQAETAAETRQAAVGQPSAGKAEAPGREENSAEPETVPAAGQEFAESAYQKELSAVIARVYVLREAYTMALDNMYDAAKAEYIDMPADKRTKAGLAKLASRYLDKAAALERECDIKMDAIVASLEELIRENKGDMSLVDTVVYTYANEKSLKKSWYMSKLAEKGLI